MTHASIATAQSNRFTILVAEDDRELQELYELLLADDYDTLHAYNGREATVCVWTCPGQRR